MGLIAIIVFLAVFTIVALIFAATGSGSAKQDREMLARLDSALATGKSKSDMSDLLVDVRKNELLSTIPWIDKVLRQSRTHPALAAAALPGQRQVDGRRLADVLLRRLRSARLPGLPAHGQLDVRSGNRRGLWLRPDWLRHVQAHQSAWTSLKRDFPKPWT